MIEIIYSAIKRPIIIRGGLLGVFYALISSIVFALIEGSIANYNDQKGVSIEFFLIIGFFALASTILVFIPAFLGGVILTVALSKEKLSSWNVFWKGFLLGAISGLGVCMFVLVAVPLRIGWKLILVHISIVTILSSLAGGSTALHLSNYLIKQSLMIQQSRHDE